MLQMMFDDLPQLNNGNLNMLLENDNALDIATTFSVTMPSMTTYDSEVTVGQNTVDSTIYGTNNQYSGNCVYTMADFQPSTSSQNTTNSVRYQPYCVQQRMTHDVPDQRDQLPYQNTGEYLQQPTGQFSTGANNPQTASYVGEVINQPPSMTNVCQFGNYGENNNGQGWTEQIPSSSYYDQTNSNANNNNSSLVNQHSAYLNSNSYQNNQLNENHQNQFACPTNFNLPNYQNHQENKVYHTTPSQQIQLDSGSYNQYIAQQMNLPPSPTEPLSSRKKTSPEPKKKNKRKKGRKGMNEPQKPVSAYALFFRDTQAAIKAENPSASFGEISKIVASMWDTLSEEAKKVYKQKTETAKRDYLKQLAMFKANTISMGVDVDDEDMQPLSVLKEKMASSSSVAASAPVVEQQTPSSPIITPPQQIIDLTSPDHSSIPTMPMLQLNKCDDVPQTKLEEQAPPPSVSPVPQEPELRSKSPPIIYKQIILSNQKGSKGTITFLSKTTTATSQTSSASPPPPTQMKRIVLTPMSTPGTSPTDQAKPSPIHLRNIVSKSPLTFIPSKQGQIIKVLQSPSGKLSTVTIPKVIPGAKTNLIKLNSSQPITLPSPPVADSTPTIVPDETLSTTTTITHVQPESESNTAESETSMEEQLPKLPTLQIRPQVPVPVAMETDSPRASSPVTAATMPTLKQIPKLSKEPDIIMEDDLPITNELEDEPMSTEPPVDEEDQQLSRKKASSPVTIMLTTEPEKVKPKLKPVVHKQQSNEATKKSPSAPPKKLCSRNSCQRTAVSHTEWNGDYCGYECVAKHCRDVMDAWISARQVTASLG